jgi:hypothetical protein
MERSNSFQNIEMINRLFNIRFMICVCLMLECSCATQRLLPSNFTAETSFNKDAGFGKHLLITVNLEGGGKLLFAVDTGSPYTVLSKTLESQLGRCLGTRKMSYELYGRRRVHIYNAPKLYLDNVQVMTGDHVLTDDLGTIFGDYPVMGILGMDCLKHYLVHLDFVTNKMRLLGPEEVKKTGDWGKPFRLHIFFGEVWVHGDFFGGGGTYFRIDTGWLADGALESKLYEKVLARQKTGETARLKSPDGAAFSQTYFKNFVFGNQSHQYLVLDNYPTMSMNIIGLRFLMRNRVTLDFPNRVMYLEPRGQPTSN